MVREGLSKEVTCHPIVFCFAVSDENFSDILCSSEHNVSFLSSCF